jgi:hypothetical protein
VRLASGKTYPYGFGWTVDEAGGKPLLAHGGAWQGFKTYLARYLGADLTVIVLANLAQADPGRIAEKVAAAVDPTLARKEPAPIADREPAVTARLRALLAAARDGKLRRDDFAYVRAGFFPGGARALAETLKGRGEPTRVSLLERVERGDDRIYTYEVAYGDDVYRVGLGLAPDDKLSSFWVGRQ